MLKLIGITRAKVAVVSMSRQAIAFKVASSIKKNFPNIKVVVKISDEERVKKLEEQRPDFLLISAGFDSRINDSLGCFDLSDDCFCSCIDPFSTYLMNCNRWLHVKCSL